MCDINLKILGDFLLDLSYSPRFSENFTSPGHQESNSSEIWRYQFQNPTLPRSQVIAFFGGHATCPTARVMAIPHQHFTAKG